MSRKLRTQRRNAKRQGNRRANPLQVAMTWGVIYTASAFFILTVAELFTIRPPQWPFDGISGDGLVAHLAVFAFITLGGLFGATAGFRPVSGSRVLGAARVSALGALFGVSSFAFTLPLMRAAGFEGGALLIGSVAALIAYVGGRLLSHPSAVLPQRGTRHT